MVQVPAFDNAFLQGADDAFETIRQAVSSDYSRLTKEDLILFIENLEISSFNASTRLNDFYELVRATLDSPLSKKDDYLSGAQATYDLFVDKPLLEYRSSKGWAKTLQRSGITLENDGVVTKDEFIQYINKLAFSGVVASEAWWGEYREELEEPMRRAAQAVLFNREVENVDRVHSAYSG